MAKTLLPLIAALKRNDRVAITAAALDALGHTERAEEASKASRATVAFFDRSFAGLIDEETAEVETPEVEAAEEKSKDLLSVADIKTLIVNGRVKKAKRAFKAQFSKDHPNYKELKKLIKEAK